MSTPEQPSFEEALARAREASKELAAALDDPPPWEPIWKRPRKPKSKAEKKQELRRQRRRLQDAGRPASPPESPVGPAPGRAGSATPPPAATLAPVPGAALHRLAVVPDTPHRRAHRVRRTGSSVPHRCARRPAAP